MIANSQRRPYNVVVIILVFSVGFPAVTIPDNAPGQEAIPIKKKGKFEAARTPKRPAQPTAAERHSAAHSAKGSSGQKKAGTLPMAARVGIIAGAVVLLVVVAVCAYGFSLKNGDTIFPNVYVAGVNVGGLKREAAVTAVEGAVNTSYASDTLRVVLPDRTLELDPEITNVALNADEAVDEAMRYGREGGPLRAIRTYLGAKSAEHAVSLNSTLNLDTDYIRRVIDEAAEDVRENLVQPAISVNEASGIISVTTGSPSITLDADALYEAVLERFETNDLTDLRFDYDTVPCDAIDLQSYYDQYCTEMADAYYDEEAHELVEEVTGYGFDLPYYTQQIAMAEPGTSITIQMEDLIPEVTLEKLKQTYFADTLAKYDSPHTAIPARTTNLELACKAINGTVLNPGEEFSFNGIVGERTSAKGYMAATVYLDGGKSEAQEGGGVCQVSSTIYECVLLANLQVTERAPHMFEVTYVPRGQDATVYWGQQDFKFKNSTDYPLRIDASVSGGYVHIALVGTKDAEADYDHVTLSYSVLATKPWKNVGVTEENAPKSDEIELTLLDETGVDENGNTVKLAQGSDGQLYVLGSELQSAYTGANIAVTRSFCDVDGNVLRSESIGTSSYTYRDRKYLITPYVEPEPEEPDEPDDPWYDPDDPWYSGDDGDDHSGTSSGSGSSGDTGFTPWF